MTLETENAEAAPPVTGRPNLVDRVKRILLEPRTEWERIDAEPSSVGEIYRNWVLILAAIPPVAGLIGSLVFGTSFFGITYRPSVLEALGSAATQYVLTLVGVFVLALIIDALAPHFGGTANRVQAMKVAAYSATASWVAGIFGLIPALAILGLLGLYSLYLLYLGLPRLMKAPEDKAAGYTIVTIVAAIVLALLIGVVMAPITGALRGPVGAGDVSGTVTIPGGGELDLGKLEEASKQMEVAAKRMEQSAGAAAGAAGAAGAAAGAALAAAQLQAMLPASLGAWQRTETSSSGANSGGFGGSQAEGRYQNGDSDIRLTITDIAAAGAFAGLASAFNAESNRETASGYEKTGTVDGRMTTEKWDRDSKSGTYGVLVANRFMVEAEGSAPNVDTLKSAVNAVGIGKLEALAR